MGLTAQSTGLGALNEVFEVKTESPEDIIVALAGNPNTGKSTVFNSLTGLRQHTGNWPGKTVSNAQGRYTYNDKDYILVDLPGTYSLLSNSVEEEVARDFICFGNPHVTVVVTDATSLQRNLNLVLQILEITKNVIVCVNLMDEAKRKKIHVDTKKLAGILGVPVVATSARNGQGLEELKAEIAKAGSGSDTGRIMIQYEKTIEDAIDMVEPHIDKLNIEGLDARWASLRLLEDDRTLKGAIEEHIGSRDMENEVLEANVDKAKGLLNAMDIDGDGLRDSMVFSIVKRAETIGEEVIQFGNKDYNRTDQRIDRILTSKLFGIPIMVALLGLIFWITLTGANYPSELIATGLFWIEGHLTSLFWSAGAPAWLHGILVLGIYRTLAWVVSVMLPPMAIFFPLFTLLEDLGYLPRIAFNLDSFFKRACAHGKQALTMCMGFGCNAAGVVACRIIDSPRERIIATLTNNFVPCNGRFPTLIALAVIFIVGGAGGAGQSLAATLTVLTAIVLGVMITLAISRVLSQTVLRGIPSSFSLELPPYRKPQIGRIIVRSILDRTLFVLGRAIIVAAPAGVITWTFANIFIGDHSILQHGANLLAPFGHLLGLDGFILMAFILGLPANEIVLPILIMSYMSTGQMIELDNLQALKELFVANGWTWLTAVCTMLFCLNHFPCGTTLLTIKKETQSTKWTLMAFAVTTATGIILCFIVAQGARLLGLA